MPERDVPWRRGVAVVFHYLLAITSVLVALAGTKILQPNSLRSPLFLLAIILSSWFGGLGPGIVAGLVSTIFLDYFFLPPYNQFKLHPDNLPLLVVFFVSAVLVSYWSALRRRSETELRRARDEQEAKVQERTAELRQANEQLQAEIAERLRVEATLRERASLLDLTHDTIFVRDMNDRVTYWNRGASELYGWKDDETRGEVIHTLLRTVFPKPIEQINAQLHETDRWEGELIHTKRDGTQVIVASRWSLLRDGARKAVAILESNNDITGRKRAQQALQKTQAELAHVARVATMGELTSSIAHEVNQPLAAIVTNGNACLRWLSNSTPNVDEAKQSVSRIVRDGHRASEVVGRVRAFFKKAEPEKTEIDVNKLIEDVISMVDGEVRGHRVHVRTELTPDLPPALADRIQVQQVLLNLVINGIEAMSAVNGLRELRIKSRSDDKGSVQVSVEDTGTGFSSEDADKLFQAFFTTKQNGLGMGLSISRTTIEAYGGRLWATRSENGGAVFEFTLPTNGMNA